jgi:hypothetical protein
MYILQILLSRKFHLILKNYLITPFQNHNYTYLLLLILIDSQGNIIGSTDDRELR